MNSSICNNNNKKLFISKLTVLIADYIAIVLGTLAAYYLRLNLSILPVSSNFKVEEIYVYGVVPIVFLTILLLNNTYSVVAPYWDTMKNLFRSITIGVVVSIVLMYTGHVTNDVSRLFVAFAYSRKNTFKNRLFNNSDSSRWGGEDCRAGKEIFRSYANCDI